MSQRWILGFLLISCSTFSGFSQGNTDKGGHTITLNVVVTDKSGKAISGLEKQDFTIHEDKKPQDITGFEAVQGINPKNGPPVQIVILMDHVNTRIERVAYERQQVQKFLLRDGGRLARPVILAFLEDNGVHVDMDPSSDGNALVADMNRNRPDLRTINKRDQGVYGAGDQLSLSVNALQQLAAAEASKPGRKMVIWISPGWPYLTGPNIQLSDADERNLFNEIVTLSDSLRKANITLYQIDPLGTSDGASLRTTYYQEFVKGVKKPSQVQFGNLALGAIATQTGGRVLNSSNDVAGEIATCIGDADNYYVLKFEGAPSKGPNEYHDFEVTVDKKGLKALTRTGYYAQPGS